MVSLLPVDLNAASQEHEYSNYDDIVTVSPVCPVDGELTISFPLTLREEQAVTPVKSELYENYDTGLFKNFIITRQLQLDVIFFAHIVQISTQL